jgi:intein/homing endonuclease
MQCVILREMWIRPFPMIVATRGGGKSFLLAVYSVLRCLLYSNVKVVIVGAAFRQAKLVFEYAERIWNNAPILRNMCGTGKDQGSHRSMDKLELRIGNNTVVAVPLGDGCLSSATTVTYDFGFRNIDYNHSSQLITKTNAMIYGNGQYRLTDEAYNNGFQKTKVISTAKGYTFEGTHNHKMKIIRSGHIEFIRVDEMQIGDRILIDRSYRWHNGNFICSSDDAYFLGAMIGNGCWTHPARLGFSTKDIEHFEPYLLDWKKSNGRVHFNKYGRQQRQSWLDFWQLTTAYSHTKILPDTILSSSRENMTACLQGLFDTNGGVYTSTSKGGLAVTVAYTTTSDKLVRQLQYILLHYGIICYVTSRDRNINWHRSYELLITGKNVKKFAEHIGFRLPRKQKTLNEALCNKKRFVSGDDTIPDIIVDMANFSKEHRIRRGKAIQTTAAVTYSKLAAYKEATFDIADKFLENYGHIDHPAIHHVKSLYNVDIYYDKIETIQDGETATFDIHVPDGHEYCASGFFSHNSRIRGLRATEIICDEMSSVPVEVYENVVAGFAAVTANPILNVKIEARKQLKEAQGSWTLKDKEIYDSRPINKAIISGTAYFTFNHFYEYWDKYCEIIKSRGDQKKLELIFKGEVPVGFNWRDYSVIRIPYDLYPPGFMEQTHIARSKATVHHGIFNIEYGAIFAKDTNGFFKRTLVESCVVRHDNKIMINDENVMFRAARSGSSSNKYVFAIDPASENDNFSILILEVWPTHRRIVYCWTTTRQKHRELMSREKVLEKDFYAFCARKVRKLMRKFPCVRIALDKQGGGVAVEEALHNNFMLQPGEQPIWPTIDDEKEKPTDLEQGLHILEIINFASADWVAEANHGLKKDFEDKVLLFPFYDPLVFIETEAQNQISDEDTLEDCVYEIEELKDELTCIQHTQTPSGRDKWDTPEVKLPGNKKGRQRKDRYTALLMANMVARNLDKCAPVIQNVTTGGFAYNVSQTEKFKPVDNKPYVGPEWFEKAARDAYF